MTRTGYTFAGWAFDQTATTQDYTGGYSANVTELVAHANSNKEIKLYAIWTPYKLTITYNLDGGKIGEADSKESVEIEYADNAAITAAMLPDATKDGYTFDGWYYTKEAEFDTKATTAYDVKTKIAGSNETLALKAKYNENSYTIAFDKDGGTGTAESLTNKVASAALGTLPSGITKAGYAFGGWSLNGSTPAVTAETLVSAVAGEEESGSTITLKAIWTPYKLTITYNLDGGKIGEAESKESVEIEYADNAALTAEMLPDATKDGYTFDGWYYTKETEFDTKATTAYDVKTKIAGSNETLALKAKYTENTYTIAFNTDGGTGTAESLRTVPPRSTSP